MEAGRPVRRVLLDEGGLAHCGGYRDGEKGLLLGIYKNLFIMKNFKYTQK